MRVAKSKWEGHFRVAGLSLASLYSRCFMMVAHRAELKVASQGKRPPASATCNTSLTSTSSFLSECLHVRARSSAALCWWISIHTALKLRCGRTVIVVPIQSKTLAFLASPPGQVRAHCCPEDQEHDRKGHVGEAVLERPTQGRPHTFGLSAPRTVTLTADTRLPQQGAGGKAERDDPVGVPDASRSARPKTLFVLANGESTESVGEVDASPGQCLTDSTCGKVLQWDVSEPFDARSAKVSDEADFDRAVSLGFNDASHFLSPQHEVIVVGWLPTKATCGRRCC